MAEQRKAVIKNADMSEAMQQDAVDVASAALSKYNIEKASGFLSLCGNCSLHSSSFFLTVPFLIFLSLLSQDVAAYIKKEFDKKYSPTWYVVPPSLHIDRSVAKMI